MQRTCEFCGKPYVAKRSDSRFCGPTCRSKKSMKKTAALVPMPTRPDAGGLPSLVESVRAELARAGAESSALGVSALVLASQVDARQESGSSLAALNRELRATLAEATRGQVKSGLASMRDELAERRVRA